METLTLDDPRAKTWWKIQRQSTRAAFDAALGGNSAAEAQALDELLVLLRLGSLEVVEKPTALVHQLHQTTARRMVALVSREMVTEASDPFGQQRDLHFGRPGVLGPAA